MKIAKIFAALAMAGAVSAPALAETASAPLQVTATVLKSCELSTSPVAFGTVTPSLTGVADATGAVDVVCTKSTPYTLALSTGTNSSDFVARNMVGGGGNTDQLAYNLYTTAARTTVWGDATAGTSTVAGTGTGAVVSHAVYGRLSKNQFVTPDNYLDVVTATLTY